MDNSLIGSQITKFRKAAGLTQEELGRAVGVSTQAVSRWECGGAPDIALLPAISDRLGVSVDALFGREGGEARDLEELIRNWVCTAPRGQVLDKLNRMVWAGVSQIPFDQPQIQSYLRSCVEKDRGTLLCSNVTMSEGVYFGVCAEDLAFSTICPKPQGGYQQYFADNEEYRRFFAMLAMPGVLEIMIYMLGHEGRYLTAEVIARAVSLGVEQAETILEKLREFKLVYSVEICTVDGVTKAYGIVSDGSYVPFLYLARCLLQASGGSYYLSCNCREASLL